MIDVINCNHRFDFIEWGQVTNEVLFSYCKTNFPHPDNSLLIAGRYEELIYSALWDYLGNSEDPVLYYENWPKFMVDLNELKGAWDIDTEWCSYNAAEIANLLRNLILYGYPDEMNQPIYDKPSPIEVIHAIIDFCDLTPNIDGSVFIILV